MDQNEGVLRNPSDRPGLFQGNKVTEKKDKCAGDGNSSTEEISRHYSCQNGGILFINLYKYTTCF